MPIGKATSRNSGRNRGFTYVMLLFAVALSGVLLAAAGQLWHTNVQREKEADLLFAGRQIRQAIESYYQEEGAVANGGGLHE
ncbi:MAG: type II secretion system protein, partial [Rhodocyclaceae bacterium]